MKNKQVKQLLMGLVDKLKDSPEMEYFCNDLLKAYEAIPDDQEFKKLTDRERQIRDKFAQAPVRYIHRLSGEIFESIEAVPLEQRIYIRVQQDFTGMPSLTDQSQIDENNIGKLMQKYTPDELQAYILARTAGKREIVGHDFSQEPSLQEAKNIAYRISEEFKALPQYIRKEFDTPTEYLMFCSNPQNTPQLEAWGLAKKKEEVVPKEEPLVPPSPPNPATASQT